MKITKHTLMRDESAKSFVEKNFPGYVRAGGNRSLSDTFREDKESWGCDKLVLYVWRWHGDWSPMTKEVHSRYYKPRCA